MASKVWIPIVGVIAILLLGIVTAQNRDSSPEQQEVMNGGMAGHMGGMGNAMKGMDMKDMEKMHEAMGKYLKDSSAPKEIREMHAQCGKMMGQDKD